MPFFWKRKLNKNAVKQPDIVRDFRPASVTILNQDGTAFACVDRIASEFAGLNYGVYDVKSKEKVKKNALYALLKQPNLEDRHFNFFYQSAVDYFNGGCFWQKIKINDEVVSLFRLNPKQVKISRDSATNKRQFLYNGFVYSDDDVLYIPSRFNYSTVSGGMSIFDAISSVFETANQLENFTQSSFAMGVLGKRMVIDVSGAFADITPDQALQIKDNFQSEYSGAKNAGRPILKRKGIEYSELGSDTDNRAAELSENRKFQKEAICNIFQMPTDENDIEKYFTYLNEFAIKPIAMQFQDAINSLLDEDKFYFEFDFNGLMKVSMQQRIDSYVKQIGNGMLSLNEVRAKENLSPVEAGDTNFMPANMMPWNEEIKNAYMAKQKNEVKTTDNNSNPTDEDAQHFVGGDDKQ